MILGREQAIPKPHPDGLINPTVANHPQHMTMIGDFHMDWPVPKRWRYAVLVNRKRPVAGADNFPQLTASNLAALLSQHCASKSILRFLRLRWT